MIVLDASALVDVVAARPQRDAVLAHLRQPILAPAHQLAEVSTAVVRLLRADELTAADARQCLLDAGELTQQVSQLDDGLLQRAFELRDSIRILDGIYVALAERHRCPLVTTDARLARANPPCEVLAVGQRAG